MSEPGQICVREGEAVKVIKIILAAKKVRRISKNQRAFTNFGVNWVAEPDVHILFEHLYHRK